MNESAVPSFVPEWKVVDTMSGFTEKEVKEGSMFFRAEPQFVEEHGCPLVKAFLNRVQELRPDDANIQIDSRVHMLMPGYYPCIPGWHIDNLPRDDEGNVQWKDRPDSTFYLTVIDAGTGSLTEFLDGPIFPNKHVDGSDGFYDRMDTCINEARDKIYGPNSVAVDNGDLVRFTCNDWHRGMPAQERGWRMFLRANIDSSREPRNEMRNQTQVYIPKSNVGW